MASTTRSAAALTPAEQLHQSCSVLHGVLTREQVGLQEIGRSLDTTVASQFAQLMRQMDDRSAFNAARQQDVDTLQRSFPRLSASMDPSTQARLSDMLGNLQSALNDQNTQIRAINRQIRNRTAQGGSRALSGRVSAEPAAAASASATTHSSVQAQSDPRAELVATMARLQNDLRAIEGIVQGRRGEADRDLTRMAGEHQAQQDTIQRNIVALENDRATLKANLSGRAQALQARLQELEQQGTRAATARAPNPEIARLEQAMATQEAAVASTAAALARAEQARQALQNQQAHASASNNNANSDVGVGAPTNLEAQRSQLPQLGQQRNEALAHLADLRHHHAEALARHEQQVANATEQLRVLESELMVLDSRHIALQAAAQAPVTPVPVVRAEVAAEIANLRAELVDLQGRLETIRASEADLMGRLNIPESERAAKANIFHELNSLSVKYALGAVQRQRRLDEIGQLRAGITRLEAIPANRRDRAIRQELQTLRTNLARENSANNAEAVAFANRYTDTLDRLVALLATRNIRVAGRSGFYSWEQFETFVSTNRAREQAINNRNAVIVARLRRLEGSSPAASAAPADVGARMAALEQQQNAARHALVARCQVAQDDLNALQEHVPQAPREMAVVQEQFAAATAAISRIEAAADASAARGQSVSAASDDLQRRVDEQQALVMQALGRHTDAHARINGLRREYRTLTAQQPAAQPNADGADARTINGEIATIKADLRAQKAAINGRLEEAQVALRNNTQRYEQAVAERREAARAVEAGALAQMESIQRQMESNRDEIARVTQVLEQAANATSASTRSSAGLNDRGAAADADASAYVRSRHSDRTVATASAAAGRSDRDAVADADASAYVRSRHSDRTVATASASAGAAGRSDRDAVAAEAGNAEAEEAFAAEFHRRMENREFSYAWDVLLDVATSPTTRNRTEPERSARFQQVLNSFHQNLREFGFRIDGYLTDMYRQVAVAAGRRETNVDAKNKRYCEEHLLDNRNLAKVEQLLRGYRDVARSVERGDYSAPATASTASSRAAR